MIEFGVLGPLAFRRGGLNEQIPTVMARRTLALLLARSHEPVPIDLMVEELWAGRPPRTARQALHVHISRLRRALGDQDRITTHSSGYAIHLNPGELDYVAFEQLVADAANAETPEAAKTLLHQALGLWRGTAFDGMHDMPSVAAVAERLDDLRLAAIEHEAQLDLDAGSHSTVVARLGHVISQHPYRERMRGQYMLALYRAGRQAEALEVYRQTYALLTDELGVEPTPALQQLHQRILAADPELARSGETVAARSTTDTWPRPNLLPRSMAHFTGRSDQLTALDAIAVGDGASSPVAILSAITGSAGVGKTALAVHWARQAIDRFPDGQLYINLQGYGGGEPLRPLDALTHLLSELGVPFRELPDNEQAAIARYRSVLSERRALVILDNANAVAQVRPLLATGPGCMSVVTSRDRLAGLVALDGASRVQVDTLSVEESVALLATILGRPRIDSQSEPAIALAEACGRLPLALRIAAAALTDEPDRPLADHVALLTSDNRLPLLTIDGDPDSSVRHALSHSYLRLTDDARRMFRLLGLAPVADLGIKSAAALAGSSVDEATKLLDQLRDAHLLAEHAPGRYQPHDLIRDYARELAALEETQPDRDAALDRILTWFVAQANNAAARVITQKIVPSWIDREVEVEAFADGPAAMVWFDREGPNVIEAIRAVETTRPARCWQLATAISVWLQRQRRARVGAEVYAVGLRAACAIGDRTGEAQMRSCVAISYATAGRQVEALPYFLGSLEIQRSNGGPREIALALRNVGGVLAELKRPDEAIDYLTQVLDIVEQTPQIADMHQSLLVFLGLAYSRTERQEMAIPFYRQAMETFDGTIDHLAIAGAGNNMAAVLLRLERFDEAEEPLQQSLLHAELDGHRFFQCLALVNLGHVAAHQGRIDDARDYLKRAIDADADVDVGIDDLRQHIDAPDEFDRRRREPT
jgi:DNA-binding SARP family transcriptional activator